MRSKIGVDIFLEIFRSGGLRPMRAGLGALSREDKIAVLRELQKEGFVVGWLFDQMDGTRVVDGELVDEPRGSSRL